ncbi:hypothetical protein LPJ63_004086 [Coemansia sp. RSA 2711]|nr:hypothetical protein LPJ63_004086 [Coemansia sp. RSA 2711]
MALSFPDGAVRVTPIDGIDDPDALSLAAILDADHLDSALAASYVLDLDWLVSHLHPRTRLTLIADQIQHATTDPSSYAVVDPELPQPNVQLVHSKLLLLFYPQHMRLVVSTANLAPDEWSLVHNCIYLHDFPRDATRVFAANRFSLELAQALHDLSVPFDIIASMNHVDFARATAVRVVTSVPSAVDARRPRRNANMPSYGMLRLAQVLAPEPASNEIEFVPDARLLCVGSSMGRLDANWLRDFYLCAHARDPRVWTLEERAQLVPDDLVDVAVAFHTQSQVEDNRGGVSAAGYVNCARSIIDARGFPQSSLFKLVPRTDRVLVHAKAIVARLGEQQRHGWLYVGSHNFTPAAWGRLNQNAQPYINNYEFGLVLSPVLFECREINCITAVRWNRQLVPLPFEPVWHPYKRDDKPYCSRE